MIVENSQLAITIFFRRKGKVKSVKSIAIVMKTIETATDGVL